MGSRKSSIGTMEGHPLPAHTPIPQRNSNPREETYNQQIPYVSPTLGMNVRKNSCQLSQIEKLNPSPGDLNLKMKQMLDYSQQKHPNESIPVLAQTVPMQGGFQQMMADGQFQYTGVMNLKTSAKSKNSKSQQQIKTSKKKSKQKANFSALEIDVDPLAAQYSKFL